MSTYDAPNQQVVRADGSGPADEGSGGSGGVTPSPVQSGPTKEQLLDQARELGVQPANAAMSKAELQAGIEAKLAEQQETG